MEALATRASRWTKHTNGDSSAIDETGTIHLRENEDNGEWEQVRQEEITASKDICDDLLQIHGTAPGRKQEGICRLLYENINGLQSKMANNRKLDKARQIINDLEADIVAYNEIRINWRHRANVNGLGKMFQGEGTEVRAVAAHNAHGPIDKFQEGGTALLTYGPLIDHLDRGEMERDASGLGRWVIMTFRGANNFVTRVVCGYNPCYNNSKIPNGTVYQQQAQYWITERRDLTCPLVKFREDLIRMLKEWRDAGDRLIVCLDANEHIYKKTLGKLLTEDEGLAMREVVGTFTERPLGATFFRGTKPIDAVWATSDLVVTNACVLPCGYGVGDHRLFVVDFLTSSLVGTSPVKIVRPSARRLNTRLPFVTERYARQLKKNIEQHRLLEKLEQVGASNLSHDEASRRVNAIDKDSKQYMVNAERKCRKIKSGTIPFTPETAALLRRRQLYQSLLRYQRGIR